MEKISVYLNERASNTENMIWESEIKRQLFRSQLTINRPQTLAELRDQLDRDIARQVDILVIVGGDGTVNTIVQHLAGQNVALLIIPAGTANDLANELGPKVDLTNLVHSVRGSENIVSIDTIKINGRYMVTNGGLGLGGQVAMDINWLRHEYPFFKKIMQLSGKNIYSLFLAGQLLRPRPPALHLRVESEEFQGIVSCFFFMVNNQANVAGSFTIAPHTRNNDGHFNVTILKHKNRYKLIDCILKLKRGIYPQGDEDLVSFETKKVRVVNLNQGTELNFFGDGEIFGEYHEFNISIEPLSLKVYRTSHEWCPISYKLDEDSLL